MADPMVDTASQRPATGLDKGARELVLRVIEELEGGNALGVIEAFFHDRFGGRRDYYEALERVWGHGWRRFCEEAVFSAEIQADHAMTFPMPSKHLVGAYTLLIHMPESDFRLAIEKALEHNPNAQDGCRRISEICRARGAPWVMTEQDGFEWVGDAIVERELLRPALSILEDSRFAGGVKTDFDTARNELRIGTPAANKQAVGEAASAVESAMKVLLDATGGTYAETDTAQRLFQLLVDAGTVPRYMERVVLAAALPRNKTAAHGAGATPHNVTATEAGAVVAAAAGAIAYLGKLLP
jgi:hypothetical protein